VALKKWKAQLNDELKTLLIMEKFGWTYEEYLKQPAWLVQLWFEKYNLDLQNENGKQTTGDYWGSR